MEIPIYNQSPVAVADYSPRPLVPINRQTGKARVKFDGSWSYSGNPEYQLLSWSWRVTPGTQSTSGVTAELEVDLNSDRLAWESGQTVTRNFVLRVTDDHNGMDDEQFTVSFKLLASTPATIRFAQDRIYLEQGDPLKISATATPDPTTTLDYVGWDVDGDGVDEVTWTRGVDGADPRVGLTLNLTWAELQAAGLSALDVPHVVTLTVRDSQGTVSQDGAQVTVLGQALRPEIEIGRAHV